MDRPCCVGSGIRRHSSSIVRFLEKELTFQRWAQLYQADRNWDSNPSPPQGSRLYYACYAGLIAPALDLIVKGADVNALQAASFGGYQEIVKLLLNNGADVNAQGGEYGNALYAASDGGHQEIVKLLLENGANAQGGEHGNALQAASFRGLYRPQQRENRKQPAKRTPD